MLKRLLGSGSLSQRMGKAGLWTIVGFGVGNALKLLSNLALTRLLSPEIFGLIALAQVFTTGLNMLSDVGVQASVIRSKRGRDTAFLQTAWSVQILRGMIVTGLGCLIAWPTSVAYQIPVLFPLIIVLSLTASINGFRSIWIARSQRELEIKNLTIMGIVGRMLSTVITVFLAWQLQSVWALAIGACSTALISLLLSHTMLPAFKHRYRLEPNALREIVGFGKWILLATFFTFLGGQGQQGIFGLLFPIEVIGLIAIATLLSSVPNQLLKTILNNILLPSFSEIMRERPQDLPRALRKIRIFTIGLAFPIMFATAFLAQPIVDLLYDDRYAGAGVILMLMALNGTIPILSTTYQNLLLAEGRSDLHALLMFLWATSISLGIILGFTVLGLIGSLIGVGLGTAVMFFVNHAIAVRRGYATGLLDAAAFTVIVVVYAATLWVADIPEAYLSADLIHQIF